MTLMSIESSKEEVMRKYKSLFTSPLYRGGRGPKGAHETFELLKQKVPDTFEENLWAARNIRETVRGNQSARVKFFVERALALCEKLDQLKALVPLTDSKKHLEFLELATDLAKSKEELSSYVLDYCDKYKR